MMRFKSYIITTLALLLPSISHATSITANNISLASGCSFTVLTECVINRGTGIDFGSFAAIQVERSTGSSWLFRYDLHSPSSETSSNDNGFIDTTTTPYTGSIWLEAPTRLYNSENNVFSIYTDQITLDPDRFHNDSFSSPSVLQFGLSAADATLGSSSLLRLNDDGANLGPPFQRGNLDVLDGLVICIECAIDVQLNLIGFFYNEGELHFNPIDQRSLLLSYDDFFDASITERNFYIAPVPLPASIWLFITGLIALIGFKRR